MSTSHSNKYSGENGLYVGAKGSEVQVSDSSGNLSHGGTGITLTAAQINKLVAQNTVTVLDGSTGKKACVTNGVSAITGGTGIADMTLAAPSIGDKATIRINTLTEGNVVVTCDDGVTLDGTNDVATFDAADETLVLAYKAANTWQVVMNIGSVALSES